MNVETKEPKKREAVIYVRLASIEPDDKDGTVATQEQRCRDYADEQGYAVAAYSPMRAFRAAPPSAPV